MAADFDLPGETNDALPLSWPEVDCVVRLTALGRISMTGLLTLGALGASLSVDAFAAAVRRLKDPAAFHAASVQARTRSQAYSWEDSADRLVTLAQSLIER